MRGNVYEYATVSIQRLSETRIPEAHPIQRAIPKFGLRLRILHLKRPGKHYKPVVWLDCSQVRPG